MSGMLSYCFVYRLNGLFLQVDLKHDLSLCSDDGRSVLNERCVTLLLLEPKMSVSNYK